MMFMLPVTCNRKLWISYCASTVLAIWLIDSLKAPAHIQDVAMRMHAVINVMVVVNL